MLSNRIEGTYAEVRTVLRREVGHDSSSKEDADVREVRNYLHALKQGQDWVQEGRPLNLLLLRSLHAELLQGVRGQDKHPGSLRSSQVYIDNQAEGVHNARFVPPPPEQVLPLLEDLIAFSDRGATYGPLIDCAILHYHFETVHPFEDGNGRVGRLLIPLFLSCQGVLDRPILYLSRYFDEHRDTYLALLSGVNTHGNWLEWIVFFLDAIRSQAADSRERVQRILALKARSSELTSPSS